MLLLVFCPESGFVPASERPDFQKLLIFCDILNMTEMRMNKKAEEYKRTTLKDQQKINKNSWGRPV